MRQAKTLVHQMTRICRERGALRKDDRVDALSIGVAWFTSMMSQDAKVAASREREKQMLLHLKKHTKSAISMKSSRRTKRRRWS